MYVHTHAHTHIQCKIYYAKILSLWNHMGLLIIWC